MFQLETTSAAKAAWTHVAAKRKFTLLSVDQRFSHWLIAGGLGIALGLYVLAASTLGDKWAILLAAAMAFPFFLMIVGNIRHPLLAIIILDIVFQLDTNFYFQEKIAAQGSISGFNFSVTSMALIALYALWISELLTKRVSLPPGLFRICLPLTVYLSFICLSVFAASDPLLSSFELATLVQIFLFFVYIAGTVRTREDVLLIVTMLMVSGICLGTFLIAEVVAGHNFNIPGLSTVGDRSYNSGGYFRPGGPIGSPIDAASFFGLMLVPSLSILLTRLKGFYLWLAVLSLSIGTIGLVLTLSRGGWIALILASSILCFFAWRRGWLSIKVPVIIVVVVVLLGLVFQNAILTRLTADDNGSARARIVLTRLAFDIIWDHPLLGIGTNNFAAVFRHYLTPDFNGEWIYSIHDKYLMVWVETGIGGLIAFVWFLLATVRRGWLVWQRGDRILSSLALGLTAAVIGQMSHMFVDVFHSRPQIQGLWLVAAVLAALSNNFSEDNHAVE